MWSRLQPFAVLAGLSFVRAGMAGLVDQGRLVQFNGISYYASGISVGQLGSNCTKQAVSAAAQIPGYDLFPLTILETASPEFGAEEFVNVTATYAAADDVFQPGFLRTVFLRSSGTGRPAINATSLEGRVRDLGTVLFVSAGGIYGGDAGMFMTDIITTVLPPGPYFVSVATGKIYQAHRLYGDDSISFVQGVISDGAGGYHTLPAVTENVMAKSIAVPSRLYSLHDDRPLAGLRLGVKDIFHVQGVATSGGNRAYFYHYGTQNTTAPAVQRLLDLGAVLVGKMGTVQFANGDRPTADWVDLHAPFNPRGDGYQNPSGSSTGPGSGIASYEWLDLAVGSDTGGSMRGPAGSQGIVGNRPSTGAISLDHVLPLSPVSDSAGVFARSPRLWADVTQAWYPDMLSNFTAYPSKIYRSTADGGAWSGGTAGPDAKALIARFVQGLERFLGTATTPANYTQLWAATRGPQAPADVNDMFYLTYGVFVSHDQWKLLGQPFFEDYARTHDGRQPYVNPGPLARWQWGQIHATDDVYAQALHNISVFRAWYETAGYGRHDPESCSEGLYVYPWTVGAPSYRDEYFDAPTMPPMGFDDSSVPVMAGAPEVVVPIGEVPYNSTKTRHTEYLPVTMALRMARGCDYVLASLVRDLESAGLFRPVAAGSRLYP